MNIETLAALRLDLASLIEEEAHFRECGQVAMAKEAAFAVEEMYETIAAAEKTLEQVAS